MIHSVNMIRVTSLISLTAFCWSGYSGSTRAAVEALVAPRPEQQEPVPAAVERQMPQRPLHTGADLVVVARVGEHPLRGALKDGEALDIRRDRRCDLKSAGARADHGDPLPVEVDGVVPALEWNAGPAKSRCPSMSGGAAGSAARRR